MTHEGDLDATDSTGTSSAPGARCDSPWQPLLGPTPFTQLLAVTPGSTVAIMGAGGKHTLMAQLQQELSATGQGVLLTSSTQLHRPKGAREPHLILADSDRHWHDRVTQRLADGHAVYLLEHDMGKGMLKGLSMQRLTALRQQHPRTLMVVKADGARKRSLKAPASHEPAVPPFSNVCVVIVGIDCLGRPLDEECVHRPEVVAQLAGLEVGESLSIEAVARVIGHERWYSSRLPHHARRVLYLSKVAGAGHLQQAQELFDRVPDAAFPLRAAGDTPTAKVHLFRPSDEPESSRDDRNPKRERGATNLPSS